ncbi:MAG: hypothetical protein AMJ75_06385 [Phycisphaerae bacterium SM1_79]|nr:MAG: hypothetical protein AMJ75_06385 [Phycisphaerae bacterium SM1_79]
MVVHQPSFGSGYRLRSVAHQQPFRPEVQHGYVHVALVPSPAGDGYGTAENDTLSIGCLERHRFARLSAGHADGFAIKPFADNHRIPALDDVQRLGNGAERQVLRSIRNFCLRAGAHVNLSSNARTDDHTQD